LPVKQADVNPNARHPLDLCRDAIASAPQRIPPNAEGNP